LGFGVSLDIGIWDLDTLSALKLIKIIAKIEKNKRRNFFT
jgi:hypothetical protein